jgi:hypothetical protein
VVNHTGRLFKTLSDCDCNFEKSRRKRSEFKIMKNGTRKAKKIGLPDAF